MINPASIFIMLSFFFDLFEEMASFQLWHQLCVSPFIYTMREMHNSDTFEPVTKPASWSHLDQLAGMRSGVHLTSLDAHLPFNYTFDILNF
jgi:hypothetical protein